jgi:hypothetical protein
MFLFMPLAHVAITTIRDEAIRTQSSIIIPHFYSKKLQF